MSSSFTAGRKRRSSSGKRPEAVQSLGQRQRRIVCPFGHGIGDQSEQPQVPVVRHSGFALPLRRVLSDKQRVRHAIVHPERFHDLGRCHLRQGPQNRLVALIEPANKDLVEWPGRSLAHDLAGSRRSVSLLCPARVATGFSICGRAHAIAASGAELRACTMAAAVAEEFR